MALEVWWIGKNKQNSDIQDYLKRLGRYSQVQMVQWKDSKKKDRAARIKEESTALLQKMKRDDYLILLDEKGKNLTSIEWAQQLNDSWLRKKRTILLIGGAYGVSDEIKSRANQKIALSKLTFPHELARLILIEQIYRAFTILNKENYHHI